MVFNPIQALTPKKFLGVDIGTSYVKIMEISKFGNRRKLEGYGALASKAIYEKPFRTFEKNTLHLSDGDISRAIAGIFEEANFKSRQAIFSIPDFSTFFINFEIPKMTKEELPEAIRYEAKQYVPLPLSEVTLDWKIIDSKSLKGEGKIMNILLVAVPNEVISQYRAIAYSAKLELFALEAEAFSLARSLIKDNEKETISIIDIGAQSTTCNIIEMGNLKISHSFDMSSGELTGVLTKSLSISHEDAEKIKKEQGILPNQKFGTRETLLPLIDIVIRESELSFNNFSNKSQKPIKKIILAGGAAHLPGLRDYFKEKFQQQEVIIANPFADLFYPPILDDTLKEMGPSYAIAVGAALRGTEY